MMLPAAGVAAALATGASPAASASAAVIGGATTTTAVAPPPAGTVAPPATVQPAATGLVGTVAPARLYDSRADRPLAAGEERSVCDTLPSVPDDASAVVLNLTVVSPSAAGHLSVWPTGTDAPPPVSVLNFVRGSTVSNLAVVPLGAVGCVDVHNASRGTTHVVVDVQGYLTAGPASAPGATQTIYGARLLDTRTTGVAIPARSSIDVQVAGRGGIPATSVRAAWLNLTVTGNAAAGFVAAYPTGTVRPTSSSVNFGAGETRAALALATVGANGRVTVYNGSTKPVHLVVDASGWSRGGDATGTLAGLSSTAPRRVLDTRTSGGAVAPRDFRSLDLPSGAPANAPGIVVAVTATSARAAGFLSVDSGLGTSVVNYSPGRATTNLVLTRTGPGLTVYNASRTASVDVVVDVVGWVNPERGLAGRVVDPDGSGVGPASLGNGPARTPYYGTTATDGSFSLPLPPTVTSATPCAVVLRNGFPDPAWALGCNLSAQSPRSYALRLGERLTAADIPVEPAGALRGTAKDFAGAKLTSGEVTVRRAGDDRSFRTAVHDGTWVIPGVAAGDYFVDLAVPASTTSTTYGLAGEWYPDIQRGVVTTATDMAAAGAVPQSVTQGSTTTVDLVAEANGTISGTVASADASNPLTSSLRVVTRRTNGSRISSGMPNVTTRSWAGTYHPGAVVVCASRAAGQPEYCWEGNVPVEAATPVGVTSQQERSGIDLALP